MYNRFSEIYDKLVFDINYKNYSQNIFKILKENQIESGDLLEIGCGTGNLTVELSKGAFNITAFDNSIEMLNIAYSKVVDFENVILINKDMYKFPYGKMNYDIIVSLLDVINYILDENKLYDLFSKIYTGLKNDGLFIFDLNSYNKLIEVLGNNTFVYEKDNIFYTWENRLDGDLVNFHLNFFVKEKDKYSRIVENQVERYYSLEYIENILKQIGFKSVNYFDEDGGKYKDKTQRILFYAKK